jgi:hypothetical protein
MSPGSFLPGIYPMHKEQASRIKVFKERTMNELMNLFGQPTGPQSFDAIRISIASTGTNHVLVFW